MMPGTGSECYVLDSCALLVFLQDEAGAEMVEGMLRDAAERKSELYMSVVNLGEVIYITE